MNIQLLASLLVAAVATATANGDALVVEPWPVVAGTWDASDPAFVSKLVKQRVPVVFRRDLLDYPHPATRWAPLRKWNPYSMWAKSLKEHTILPNVRVSRDHAPDAAGLAAHVFTLATNRSAPLMTWAVPPTDELSYTDGDDMPMHEVMDECCGFRVDRGTTPQDCAAATTAPDAPRKRHLYFTSHLDAIGSLDSTTQGAAEIEAALHVPTKEFAEKLMGFHEEPSESALWLGCSGVRAQTHYDKSHNFFIQVVGEKEWTLWSPEYWRALRIHSAFHPYDRQSQVPWPAGGADEHGAAASALFRSNPRAANFPAGARPWRVTLQEGDLLYVPPYWAHRVESKTLAAGVSVLSASEEEMILAKLKSWADEFIRGFVESTEQLPGGQSGDDDAAASVRRAGLIAQTVRAAIRGVVGRTVATISGDDDAGVNQYLQDVYDARFAADDVVLAARTTIPFASCAQAAASSDKGLVVCSPCVDDNDGGSSGDDDAAARGKEAELATAHEAFVNATAHLLVRVVPVPVGTADLIVMDLAEHLINAAFGAEHIAAFFNTCVGRAGTV